MSFSKTFFSIEKKFDFEAAHILKLPYDSPCNGIHGHSYKVYITIYSGNINENDMVVDFSMISNKIKEWIKSHLDHSIMVDSNDPDIDLFRRRGKVYEFKNRQPTAESIAELLCGVTEGVCRSLSLAYFKIKVTVYETESSCASFEFEII